MGESEESVFWNEKEDGHEGIFTLQQYESNHCVNDQQSATSKRIRLSPKFNLQEGDVDSYEQPSPLGLILRKTPSFLSLVERSLSKEKHAHFPTQDHNDKPTTKKDDLGSHEKLKASNFPAIFIKIGSWQRQTRHEGDLTAKLYYAKHKLVWEVLDGALKSKIEIQWSDIVAIRAITPVNEPGTLEIELNQPPMFYREINPQPRKHTLWQQTSDFTGGQAPIWRRHYVRFPPGILDKHYEKLLQCDQRMFALSLKQFPRHESPYFDPTIFGILERSLSFSEYGSTYLPYAFPMRGRAPNSTFPVMDLPFPNEGQNNNQFPTQTQTRWDQGPSHIDSTTQVNQVYHSPNFGVLSDMENRVLGESHVGWSNEEGNLGVNMGFMCSLLEPSNVDVIENYTNYSGTSYLTRDGPTDQVMHDGRYINPHLQGYYSEPANWMPHQHSNNNNIVMDQTVNKSLPPFVFPANPTNEDLF